MNAGTPNRAAGEAWGDLAPYRRIARAHDTSIKEQPSPCLPRGVEAQLAELVSSEQAVLSALDKCGRLAGGLDVRNVALASGRALPLVIGTLNRLRERELVVYHRPYWMLAPRVARWLGELEKGLEHGLD